MVVLGQVVAGRRRRRPARRACEVELVLDTLYEDDDHEYLVWRWQPGRRRGEESRMSTDHEVAVLGVGMHPWGKWGRNFVEYGIDAAQRRAGRRRPRVGRRRSSSPAPTPSATATPASSPAPPSARRWAGRATGSRAATRPAPRAPRRSTSRGPRSWPGFCDVALVVGADTTPKGFFAPVGGDRPDDPDWLRFRLLGRHQPDLLRALRPPPHGAATAPPSDDFARVRGQERAPRR